MSPTIGQRCLASDLKRFNHTTCLTRVALVRARNPRAARAATHVSRTMRRPNPRAHASPAPRILRPSALVFAAEYEVRTL